MKTDENNDWPLSAAVLAAWRAAQGRHAPPDEMQMAAWLEGRLDEAGAAAVERALACDPVLLDAMLAAREVQPLKPAAREVEAARALVRRRWRQRWVHGLEARRPQWAMGLSAALLMGVACMGALEMGQALALAADARHSASLRLVLDDDLSAALEER